MSLSVPKAVFIALAIKIFLYSIYTYLFIGSLYLLLFRWKKTKVIITMAILNTIMWFMSTGHVTLNFEKKFQGFFLENGIENDNVLEDNSSLEVLSQLVLECINFIIGDSIVLWGA
ncbi:hypothetical protein DFS33DRAFT_1382436 [Desarmillaria ectypa]|nr:hypothetical protein DFS33DRAFT_1382436 [Desarmillaria ectypa]